MSPVQFTSRFRQQLQWAFVIGMVLSMLGVAWVASTEERKLLLTFGEDVTPGRVARPVTASH